jgi:spore coat protein U-like protein
MVSGTKRHRRFARTLIADAIARAIDAIDAALPARGATLGAAAALLLALAPSVASAQCNLIVALPQMTFTNYSPFGSGVAAQSTIIYSCNNVAQAWVGIEAPRLLADGSETLQFEVYADAGHTVVWPQAPPRAVPANGFGAVTVYGLLPPQDAAAGNYTVRLEVSIYAGTIGNRTDTLDLRVRATVRDECVINPATLAFGSYYPFAGGALDAQGTIRIACTRNTAYDVGLGTGNNPAGAVRRMANGGARLQYQLYSDGARTTVWDNNATVGNTAASTAPVDLPVYGRVAPGQMVPMGPYQDTVTSTINF